MLAILTTLFDNHPPHLPPCAAAALLRIPPSNSFHTHPSLTLFSFPSCTLNLPTTGNCHHFLALLAASAFSLTKFTIPHLSLLGRRSPTVNVVTRGVPKKLSVPISSRAVAGGLAAKRCRSSVEERAKGGSCRCTAVTKGAVV